MRLYVCGPMRGRPNFNFPEFDRVCAKLRAAGHTAIGPQELDRLCGFNERLACEEDVTSEMIRSFMLRDLVLILTEADGLVALTGWPGSSGCMAEVALARCLGIPVFDENLNRLQFRLYASSEEDDE